jgi:hypothetical protein
MGCVKVLSRLDIGGSTQKPLAISTDPALIQPTNVDLVLKAAQKAQAEPGTMETDFHEQRDSPQFEQLSA